MASTTIADYQVLTDSNFTLSTQLNDSDPKSKVLTFKFPSDFNQNQGTARRPILAFKVRPFLDCDLTVFLDDREIMQTSFDKSHTRGYWEAFTTQNFQRTNNQSEVKFIITQGRVRFGDVIIWYQIRR